jgi:hypothetical protein
MIQNDYDLVGSEKIKAILKIRYSIGGFDRELLNEWSKNPDYLYTEYQKLDWDKAAKKRFATLLKRIQSQAGLLCGERFGYRKLAETLSVPLREMAEEDTSISHTTIGHWINGSKNLTPSFTHLKKISCLRLKNGNVVGWTPQMMFSYLKGEIALDNSGQFDRYIPSEEEVKAWVDRFVHNSPIELSIDFIIKILHIVKDKALALVKREKESEFKANEYKLKEALARHSLAQMKFIANLHTKTDDEKLLLNADDKRYLYSIAKYYVETYYKYLDDIPKQEQLSKFVEQLYEKTGIPLSFIDSISTEPLCYQSIQNFCDCLNEVSGSDSLSAIALLEELTFSKDI